MISIPANLIFGALLHPNEEARSNYMNGPDAEAHDIDINIKKHNIDINNNNNKLEYCFQKY